MDEMALLREAKEIIESSSFPNIEGVAIGYKFKGGKNTDEVGIVVYVSEKIPENQLNAWQVIPKVIMVSGHGIKTDVVQKKFKALVLADRERPVKPGYSISHPNVSRGTLGFFAKRDNLTHLVTNNHIAADSNRAKLDDPIYYPGTHDGGTKGDTIAYLAAYVPIDMIDSQCPIANFFVNALNWLAEKIGSSHRIPKPIRQVTNVVDCAAARIADGVEITKQIPTIGQPMGIEQAALGMKVQKTGATSGYTEGEIIAIEAMINVSYPQGIAVFEDQIISDIPSEGGDSGSAILTYENKLVGLLFAGSEGITVMNPIEEVFEALELEI